MHVYSGLNPQLPRDSITWPSVRMSHRSQYRNNKVPIHHIDGKVNLANIITKEFKDITHFLVMHHIVTYIAPSNTLSLS